MPVGDDDMIQEVDAHQVAGMFDRFRQLVIGLTGRKIARRMVVADGKDGAVGDYGFTYNNADINRCLGDAAMRDAGNSHRLRLYERERRRIDETAFG